MINRRAHSRHDINNRTKEEAHCSFCDSEIVKAFEQGDGQLLREESCEPAGFGDEIVEVEDFFVEACNAGRGCEILHQDNGVA